MPTTPLDLVTAAKEIVVAYVSQNSLSDDKVPGFIERVHASLTKISSEPEVAAPAAAASQQDPAVPIRKSITEDYIVCLEDGKRLKVMTRYLRTKYGMTPEQYRQKWNLPHDYPMTAPGYSKQRSAMAHGMGLGRVSKKKVLHSRGEKLSAE